MVNFTAKFQREHMLNERLGNYECLADTVDSRVVHLQLGGVLCIAQSVSQPR